MKEVFLLENRQLRKKFTKILDRNSLEEYARSSKFKIRNKGKITPEDFLWLSCFSGHNLCASSLEELCASLHLNRDVCMSPQALDQRINESSTEFLKYIFSALCGEQFRSGSKAFKSWGFSKIFLMDSTEIKLPERLKDKYKGTNSSNPATLKINLFLELLNYSVENTVLTAGKTNEHNFSKYIYDKLNTDSLVLKDLGYFKFEDFNEIEGRNSFFISRLRAGTRLFKQNPKFSKGGRILKKTRYLVTNAGELGEDLETGETREYEFFVGSHDDKRPFRVVLTKLRKEVSKKRLTGIEDRERRRGHCAKHARSSAEISGYITNLWAFDPSEIAEIYRLRWQIELLFKVFKSDFNLDKLKNIKAERIESHIYATLIRFFLLMELTKEIVGGYSDKLSIRRILKSSMEGLNDFLRTLKDEESFKRLLTKLEKIITSKIKKLPAN